MESLRSHILNVLDELPPDVPVRGPLLNAFSRHAEEYATIERGFRRLTSHRHDTETLRRFFASWSQTNNSAMTVAGISNRLTLKMHHREPVRDPLALLQALTALHRISDEDLAVTHKVLHSEMFYNMATDIVGDDEWMLHRYVDSSAAEFKVWKDYMSLREADVAMGLLTTLSHEVYTHGEVEFILPLFKQWLVEHYEFSEHDAERTLIWIRVHCGGTEKRHFFHAVETLHHYDQAVGVDYERCDLEAIAVQYLAKKAAVLHALFPASHE